MNTCFTISRWYIFYKLKWLLHRFKCHLAETNLELWSQLLTTITRVCQGRNYSWQVSVLIGCTNAYILVSVFNVNTMTHYRRMTIFESTQYYNKEWTFELSLSKLTLHVRFRYHRPLTFSQDGVGEKRCRVVFKRQTIMIGF